MLQFLFNASSLASIYVSFALGLALVFGVMRTLNMAHGELFMLGGFTFYLASKLLAFLMAPYIVFLVALIIAFVVVGALGWLLQISLFKALGDNPFSILMGTLSLSYILQATMAILIGSQGRTVPSPIKGFYFSDGLVIPYQRVAIIIGVSLAVIALWAFLMRTNSGRSIRAVAQDARGAVLQGVSLRRVGGLTMALGAGLAGFSGVLIASINAVHPYMGVDALWRAFIIIIVGGVGSVPGAVLAAILFAVLDTALTTLGQGNMIIMVDALVMLLVLAFRPNGLLGEKESTSSAVGSASSRLALRASARRKPIGLYTVLAIVALVLLSRLPHMVSSYYQSVLILFAINAVIVMAYRMTTTMGGWSFAHIAITGLGAYTMAILTQENYGWSVWATLPLAMIMAGIFAALIAIPVLRTRGFYFFLSTFAAGEALRQSFQQFPHLTGGLSGIVFIPRPEPIFGISFETPESFFALCLVFVAIAALIFLLLERSRIGRTVARVASNEELSLSLGINSWLYRSFAFAAGSMITAAAGVLLASYNGLINPLDFNISFMFKILSAAIIGGVTTIWGPVLGLLYITLLEECLRSYEQLIPLFYGASVIAILIFADGGLEQVALRMRDRAARLFKKK